MNRRSAWGRAEVLLRVVGLAIWAFVGLARGLPALHPLAHWIPLWLAFGLAFLACSARRVPDRAAVALLALQSVCALALPYTGLPGSEGVMLAVVVAQVPTVLTLRASAVWALAQLVALIAVVWPVQPANTVVAIGGAYGTFAAFALGVLYLLEREATARRELARVHGELLATQGLLAESTRANERLRIARELHDSLGHHLAAISIQLELASRLSEGRAADAVRESHGMSRRMLTELREVVAAMRAGEPVDLASALRTMAAAIPDPVIECDLGDEVRVTDPTRAHALFRCAQEAVTNALKHADATRVLIALHDDNGALSLRVRDDGRGVRNPGRGNGLNGMRERIAEFGGDVSWGPGEAGGFEVTVRMPVGSAP